MNILDRIPIVLWVISLLAIVIMFLIIFSGIISKPEYSKDTLKYFDEEFLERANSYSKSKLLLYAINNLIKWSLTVLFLFIAWDYLGHFSVIKALLFLGLFLLALQIITFPISYYRGFVLEKIFNLTNQSFNGWLIDYLKSFMVSFFVYLFLLGGLYLLLNHASRYWLILAIIVLIIFIVLGTYLYPLIIDPLFYKFEPLENRQIRSEIKTMAQKIGIGVEEIMIADASRRTMKSNAYFTGIGKSKKIVIYDNLLNNFSEDEALAVIAHEMGHWKKMHLFLQVVMASIGGIIVMFFIKLIINAMGIRTDFKSIIIAFLIFSLLSFIALPLQNYISRQFEKEADRISINLTQKPEVHIELMQKLAKSNLSNVEPNKVIKYILYSHPSIMERIKMAANFE